jgi:hypothetical protein
MRATLSTKEEYNGQKRKLAWFTREGKGLYFEVGSFFLGSHTSYHVDGNVFRTSPATYSRPRFQGLYTPLDKFSGWVQLGITMVSKDRINNNQPLKGRDRKIGNLISEVELISFEANNINLVVELLHEDMYKFLNRPGIQPPEGAVIQTFKLGNLIILITVLGHNNNLLIRPLEDGFQVSHYNSRYSANAPGVKYTYEAYG